ncbi:unnamed protein product, partial [Allacma fusca]
YSEIWQFRPDVTVFIKNINNCSEVDSGICKCGIVIHKNSLQHSFRDINWRGVNFAYSALKDGIIIDVFITLINPLRLDRATNGAKRLWLDEFHLNYNHQCANLLSTPSSFPESWLGFKKYPVNY